MLRLPIDSSWNVIWDSQDGNYASTAQSVRVTYPKGKFASAAGAHFRARPGKTFPTPTIAVSYEVFFPDDWDFVLGGKLPGFWGGDPGAGGGNWNDGGWSARVMFREKGEAVAYVYMATDQGRFDGTANCPLVRQQGPGFDDIAHHTNGAGIDMWRGKGLRFRKGVWNAVTISGTVNSPGKCDGTVSLTVNGATQSFSGMRWSKRPMNVEGFIFSSWMGGGSKEYAPDKTQCADFRNIKIVT